MRSRQHAVPHPPLIVLAVVSTLALGGSPAGESMPSHQPFHVTGHVVDAESGSPLHGVQIQIRDTRLGTLTGRDGRYLLRVPSGARIPEDARVTATLIGFRTAEAPLPDRGAAAGDTVTVSFRLSPQAVTLDALAVAEQAEHAVRGVVAPTGQAVGDYARRSVAREAVGAHRPGAGEWNREQYGYIEENDFRTPRDHPLSTFSVDVDRASYSNVRRFLLREGRLPPADAVRIEEMINYFSYDYERPRGEHPVAVTTEVGRAPWAPDHRLLRVGLATQPIATEDMPPANLVFLLDVSGSMRSPDKLPLVQSAMRLVVDQLRPEDRVSIVVYAGAAGLVLEPTSGAEKEVVLEAIDRLRAGGSTAGGEGLRLAYRVARDAFRPEGNNRVILATDGDFNVGESSDAAMIRLVEERREAGVYLTVLGFGTGNLQAEKMESIAQHGNGSYAYIDGLQEARKVLVGEMGGTLLTVAKDVKVQIEFNPERVAAYRLLGYENRLLAAEDFNDDAKDAGEIGAGHTVTALYEIIPPGVESEHLPAEVDPLRYGSREGATDGGRAFDGTRRGPGAELAFVKVRYKHPSGGASRLLERPVRDGRGRVSPDFRFASAVAGFGMLLRESEYRGSITADRVMALASDGLGADEDGYRRGFLDLVRRYDALTRALAADGAGR